MEDSPPQMPSPPTLPPTLPPTPTPVPGSPRTEPEPEPEPESEPEPKLDTEGRIARLEKEIQAAASVVDRLARRLIETEAAGREMAGRLAQLEMAQGARTAMIEGVAVIVNGYQKAVGAVAGRQNAQTAELTAIRAELASIRRGESASFAKEFMDEAFLETAVGAPLEAEVRDAEAKT